MNCWDRFTNPTEQLGMFVVGCGEAVLRNLSSVPRSPIPVNFHRGVEYLGPRNPPARAGTFRGLCLVITVADGMGYALLVMVRDGLTGPLHEPYGAVGNVCCRVW